MRNSRSVALRLRRKKKKNILRFWGLITFRRNRKSDAPDTPLAAYYKPEYVVTADSRNYDQRTTIAKVA